MAKVAINGLGRIGRATLKIVMDTPGLDLVAANDIGASDNVEYLLKYDTVYGRYEKTVEATDDGHLKVGDHRLTLLREKDPARLPWKSLNVDIVFECTGAFTKREDLDAHIRAGAAIRNPVGALEKRRRGNDRPWRQYAARGHRHHFVRELHDELHHTGDGDSRPADRRQEGDHDDGSRLHVQPGDRRLSAQRPRRGRAGAANLVPTSTGAAAATARALPEYRGRFDGVAVRAPVPVGSLADIVGLAARPTTVDEVNRVFTEEAASERYRGVLGVTADPVVSSDIIKDPRASVVDLGMTQVVDGDLVKVMSWYDNEWGYSSQLVREALRIARQMDLKEP